MKKFVVIDIQDAFYNDVTQQNIDNITNHIWNIVPQDLTIILDKVNETLHSNLLQFKLENYYNNASNNVISDTSIYNLFKQGLNTEIIEYVLDKGIDNVKIEPKEYGYIRHSIDNFPHIMYYVSQLVKYVDEIYNDEIPPLETFKFIVENDDRVKALVDCCLNNEYYKINNLKDILDFFEVNYLPYENENRYEHLDKTDEIVLIGGSAAECVLEEYLYLKTLGYNNVSIDKDLIYGFYPDFEISSIDAQIETFKTTLLNVQENKFKKLSNNIQIDTNKTIGVER